MIVRLVFATNNPLRFVKHAVFQKDLLYAAPGTFRSEQVLILKRTVGSNQFMTHLNLECFSERQIYLYVSQQMVQHQQ